MISKMSAGKNNKKVGLILLAAGESSRLGRPKQLLIYNGKTLLQHSLQAARVSTLSPIVIVIGAYADTLQNEIGFFDDVHVVKNTAWKAGMASSIHCGIEALKKIAPHLEGVVLMVCDQPFVTAHLLNDLISAHQTTGKPIVASSYDDAFGPPVFFHHSLFDELLQLKGDVGARSIVRKHTNDVAVIPFPKGTFDVDTESDFKKLNPNPEE